jgi:iron complex outermembrane receptor protein
MGYFKATLVGATSSILCTLLLLSTAYARADERTPQSFDIRPQSLAAALSEFARQSHEEILFAPDIVAEKHSGGVRGTMQPLAALKILLNDSGLPFSSTPSGAILIGQAGAPPLMSTAEARDASQKEGKKNSSGQFRVAQVDQGKGTGTSSVGSEASSEKSSASTAGLAEIVVTAQKREERLQDVPIPISVVSAKALVETNQTALHDYFNQIPSLAVAQLAIGPSAVAIRGISTGINQNPTVGFTLDDVPLGASTKAGGGGLVPEVNPADLARIEVLEGPQGTLYGASSLGGLIRYVTLDPSTQALSGRLEVGASTTENAANLGANADGAVNIPISDTLAVRGSAFIRRTPGYVDNVQSGQKGVNTDQVDGGHLSARWDITSDVSLKLGALYEEDRRDGSNDVDVPTASYPQTANLHGLQQAYLPGTGEYHRQSQLYDAVLTGRIADVELKSITGYNINTFTASDDLSSLFGSSISFPNEGRTDKVSEEIHALDHIGSSVDVLLGGFYTHERSSFSQQLLSVNPSSGAAESTLYNNSSPTTYEEEAIFGDVTWRVTDKFDIQLGGRESHLSIDTLTSITTSVPSFGGTSVVPASSTTANVFTYLVTPRYKLAPGLMVYGRIASGYRPGGFTNSFCTTKGFSCDYNPDKTTDYEAGLKGTFLDGKFSIDSSLYYISWKNPQLDMSIDNGQYSFTGNGSGAKSEGVQLSAEVRPLVGLNLSGWIAYDNAVLTKALPPGPDYGLPGARLPYGARFSGNLAGEEDFPINDRLSGFMGGVLIYVGDRTGEFTSSAVRQDLKAYTQVNLRAGFKVTKWTASLYANNVGDTRGVLFGGIGTSFPFGFQYIQPRTIGVNLARDF